MKTITLQISGMTCGHCVKSVTEELSAIGADEIAIDLVKGGNSTARVSAATPLSDTQISDAVAEAGYQVIAINR